MATFDPSLMREYKFWFVAGAEAMREAIAEDYERSIGSIDVNGIDMGSPGDFIRAMPIPEMPI